MSQEKDEEAKKKWSFLDPIQRILEEERQRNVEAKDKDDDKSKRKTSSDNLTEAEPDVNEFFRPKSS